MLIDRDFLHKNLTLTSRGKTYTKDQLCRLIDNVKRFLVEEHGIGPGQKAVLAINDWPEYLIWFIAGAELGVGFVVSDYPRLVDSRSVQHKLSLYGEIDLYIGKFNKLFQSIISVSRRSVDFSAVWELPESDYFSPLAKSENVLIYSTSSGTTGNPKVAAHSHDFFAKLAYRNIRVMGFKEHDRCLHTKGMHHGSVTGVFMLPALAYCQNHYYADYLETKEWARILQEEKITRTLCFHDSIDKVAENLDISAKIHDDMTVYVLSLPKPESVKKIVGDFGYRIESIFGCVETSGPLFLPEVTQSNLESYDLRIFSGPIDDFYDITLDDKGFLFVGMPDGTIVRTGDRFRIVDSKWKFLGREDIFRKNGKTMYLTPIVNTLEHKLDLAHNINVDVIFDQEEEKIYLRLDSPLDIQYINKLLLENTNDPDYSIDCVIIGNRDQFFTGIKFDQNEVRIRCREMIKQNGLAAE